MIGSTIQASKHRFEAARERVRGHPVYKYVKTVASKVSEDDLTGLAAELAYRSLLAVFPFFIFVATLSSFVTRLFSISDPTGRIVDAIGDRLPSDASSLVESQLQSILSSQNGGLLAFGLIGALLAANAATSTLIKALNRVYNVEETRPLIQKMALSLSLTLIASIALIAGFILLVVGESFGSSIASEAGIAGGYEILVSLARWPVVIAALIAAMAFLYWAAPNKSLPLRWLSPGAVFAVIGWLVATYLFALYVSNFGSYNATYGVLAGVVILMIWFYLTSLITLVGAEINALAYELVAGDEAGN